MICVLDQFGCGGEVLDDVVLAVSELVSNALEHAPDPNEMRLCPTAAELICEMEARDPRIPKVPASRRPPWTAQEQDIPLKPAKSSRAPLGIPPCCQGVPEECSGYWLQAVYPLETGVR
ncbi:hypothetical protein SAMN05428945_4245 [Streptomyces sp. 2224.1]|nr:hypothetical protein BX261_1093 [Streptomyces sp. 2321.6]SED22578.1 hypothetical protein SAMN05428945_4245 [Streptomyces sp. 2224.1]